MQGGWVYIMTNRRDGTLYVGVTSDLARRAWEHREGLVEGFTKRYDLKHLVYWERHENIRDAIQREKSIKRWPRAWKIRTIHARNPEWNDLYDQFKVVKAWMPGTRPSMTEWGVTGNAKPALYAQPPSTMNSCAEHFAAASEARNSTMSARSSGITLAARHWDWARTASASGVSHSFT